MSQDDDSQSLPAAWGRLALVSIAAGLVLLAWQAWRNPKIQFLTPGAAPWILYPSPPQTRGLVAITLPAEFHRELVLARPPPRAILDWRCFRRGQILINGKLVATNAAADWKRNLRLDVGPRLRPGTNQITAVVWAATGPPALSLRLNTDEATLLTDESWDVSLAGALRLPAVRAGDIVEPRPGHPLYGAGTVGSAFRHVLDSELVFFVASVLAVAAWRRFGSRFAEDDPKERRLRFVAFAGLALVWLALLINNILALTGVYGFDAVRHLDYVAYLQTRGSLPLANEGWEMYQAPLYYIISSSLLRAFHFAADAVEGLRVLRLFNLFVGAANIFFVFAGLRLIFPREWKKQFAGVALAAFAPWHFCLLHYTTNELLAATLGSASLWLALRCLQPEKLRPARCVWLGLALGAACLTKASAIVLVPVLFTALAAKLINQRPFSPLAWLQTVGVAFALLLAISGWHYWRLWTHFGSPLAGNWSPGVSPPWWQRPGYTTPGYFLSFGRALSEPYFAGYYSFWDGLYSTLWGDALWGGGQNMVERPPWNYNLMTVGFVLALAPAFLVVSGAVAAFRQFLHEPRLDWMVLLGVPIAFFFALALMTLKLPFYGQAKAFYALSALLPVSAFAVVGFNFWAGRSRIVSLTALTLSLAWFVNNYAALWISPAPPAAYEVVAPTTPPSAQKIAQNVPDDTAAALAWFNLAQSSQPEEIIAAGEWYLRNDPFNPGVHAAMAQALDRLGQTNAAALHRAIGHVRD